MKKLLKVDGSRPYRFLKKVRCLIYKDSDEFEMKNSCKLCPEKSRIPYFKAKILNLLFKTSGIYFLSELSDFPEILEFLERMRPFTRNKI